MARYFCFVLGLFAGLLPTLPAAAEPSDVRSEVESFRPGHPFWLMLEAEGGAEAMDRRVEADLPDGFQMTDVRWPVANGEADDDFALVEIRPPKVSPVGPQELRLVVLDQRFVISLESGSGSRDESARDQFTRARSELPIPSPWPVWVKADRKIFEISLQAEGFENRVAGVRYIPDQAGLIDPSRPMETMVGATGKVRVAAYRPPGATYVREIDGVLVLEDAEGLRIGAYMIDGWNAISPPKDPLLAVDVDQGGVSFGLALAFALLGGMILNLMPCVFPVLSIKLFGLVRAGTHSSARLRADGLAYTAGILVSFMIVVAVLLVLRGIGEQIGWGFQLQSPGFVLGLVLLMLAVGLNLLGLFEIPGFRFSQDGGAGAECAGLGGAFSTGMLSTVMATPCTAPFMAPALGYALSQSAPLAMAVFLALGLGLALPYLAVSFVPALHTHLPRPGPWMVRLRQVLALPMFATVVWLVWVLQAQIGEVSVIVAAVGAAVVLALAIILPRMSGAPLALRTLAAIVALALFGLWSDQQMRGLRLASAASDLVQVDEVAFSREALADYRRQGKPVFLDFTAAWCITCLVQDRLVLDTPKFREFLKDNGIVLMVADWTNPDPEIAAMLESFGRSGIPFYVFYPGDPVAKPVPLPQVFTTATAIEIMSEHM